MSARSIEAVQSIHADCEAADAGATNTPFVPTSWGARVQSHGRSYASTTRQILPAMWTAIPKFAPVVRVTNSKKKQSCLSTQSLSCIR